MRVQVNEAMRMLQEFSQDLLNWRRNSRMNIGGRVNQQLQQTGQGQVRVPQGVVAGVRVSEQRVF